MLNCSEYGGILYWLDEKKQNFVKAFEERTGALVYHMIESHTGFGVLLTMLYVTKYEEEWERDQRQMVEDGYICAYVENLTDPLFSEIGGVMVKPMNGGVIRVA